MSAERLMGRLAVVFGAVVFSGFVLVWPDSAVGAAYPQVGGGPGHPGVAVGGGPLDLSEPRFVVSDGFDWRDPCGVVVGGGKVIALADGQAGETIAVAVDELSGRVAWQTTLPAAALSSWSWPTVDLQNRVVLVPAGSVLSALDLSDGRVLWQFHTPTGRPFVNVSATVAEGVAYLAEYSGTGGGANLYALSTSDGRMLWQKQVGQIGGANTVAVSDGVVALVTSDGHFRTFDATSGDPLLDVAIDPNGFFGGLSVADGFAYAVNYNFYGTATVYRISLQTGEVLWTAPGPRTDTIPVVTDEMVLVSGGDGWPGGSPSIWAYDPATGEVLWQTDLAGGWTVLPVYADGYLYAATLADWLGEPGEKLLVFDLSKLPGEEDFVVAETNLIGNSAVVANGNLYGTGAGGLVAFGPSVPEPAAAALLAMAMLACGGCMKRAGATRRGR